MTFTVYIEEVPRDDGRTRKVARYCTMCDKPIDLFVRPEDFDAYLRGEGYIQDLFPYLTADERELLLNGFCRPCFDSFCPPDDE